MTSKANIVNTAGLAETGAGIAEVGLAETGAADAAEAGLAKATAEKANATEASTAGPAEASSTKADSTETSAIVKEAENVLACGQKGSHPCCDLDADRCIFENMPDEELLYDLADLFKIFADTTRIKILYSLMGHELCVAHLAQAVGATQSAVSHQLRILKQAHLVKFRREGKNINYTLADDHVYTMLAQGMIHICE